MAEKQAKPAVDWERIEVEYRAGVLSLREIAVAHPGTSHMAIARRAKKEAWTRDLQAKIQARAEAIVTRQAVTAVVTAGRIATEREVIEASALRIAQVRGEHRAIGSRIGALGLAMLRELEIQTADPALLEQLGEMMRSPDDSGADRLNDLYRKIISTPSRIDSGKKAAEMLKHAIAIEREAYSLDDRAEDGDAGKTLSDAERASRLATLLSRARQAASDAAAG